MNKIATTLKVAALIAMGTAAIYCILAETETASLTEMLLVKAAGVALGYATVACYNRWSHTDRAISQYDRWSRRSANSDNE